MRKWKTVWPFLALVMLLGGCGKSEAEITTIAIQKDGTIEHTMIEEFTEESADGLTSAMLEKAAEYNENIAGDGVKVESVDLGEGTVKVVMTYPSAADFDGFMNMDVIDVDPALHAPFFYGTVQEAFAEGYELNVSMYGVENENQIQGREDLLLYGENKIVIYDNQMNLGAPVQISIPETPLYISDNVTLAGKKTVEVSDTDEVAYILLEG